MTSSARRRAARSTTPGPIDIGGTKCPSMTSTWITLAPASTTRRTCVARAGAKSAERIEGATRIGSYRLSMEPPQWLQRMIAVSDMRTIVECSPHCGHTETSSKRCRQFTQR